jgi:hypothetical protein
MYSEPDQHGLYLTFLEVGTFAWRLLCMRTLLYISYIFAAYNYSLDEVKGLSTGFFPSRICLWNNNLFKFQKVGRGLVTIENEMSTWIEGILHSRLYTQITYQRDAPWIYTLACVPLQSLHALWVYIHHKESAPTTTFSIETDLV